MIMQLLSQSPRGEKTLRLFLGSPEPPKGFKGNPCLVSGVEEARSLSPHNLARYAYVKRVFEMALSSVGFKQHIILSDQFIRRIIDGLEKGAKLGIELGHFTSEELTQSFVVNRSVKNRFNYYVRFLHDNIDTLSLIHSSEDGFNNFLNAVRSAGPLSVAFHILAVEVGQLWDTFMLLKRFLSKHDPSVLESLRLLFEITSRVYVEHYIRVASPPYGRAVFTEKDQEAWEFLKSRAFDHLTLKIIVEAMRIGLKEGQELDLAGVRKLLILHNKYACRFTFEYDGIEFEAEASPFIKKRVNNPSDFVIAVYPRSDQLRAEVAKVRNPAFEHIDGALSQVRMTIGSTLLVEELQSDIETLLTIGRTPTPPELADLAATWPKRIDASPELIGLIERWPSASLTASRIFARMHGFDSLYCVTPAQIYERYVGFMHPDKVAKIYAKTMESLGGELVYDDRAKSNRHYWMFGV